MERTKLEWGYHEEMLELFKKYVRTCTTSVEEIPEGTCPTSSGQFELAEELMFRLRYLGLQEIICTDKSYVHAVLPANLPANHPTVPVIGLMAHLDTSPKANGLNVQPRIIENYDGRNITFPDDPELVLKVDENPDLKECLGHTIVTASGQTLLGADDKAGIAEIMTVLKYLILKKVPHGEIRVCFNPDEEIGRGTDNMDLSLFPVHAAYTLDGSRLGEVEDECFNAATATIVIQGFDVHPGYAKDKMVDAVRVMGWIVSNIPEQFHPQATSDRQPYVFPIGFPTVTTERCEVHALLRAFTDPELMQMQSILEELCVTAGDKFPKVQIEMTVKHAYHNMKTVLDQHPEVMELADQACEIQGIKAIHKPIRGGTDGATLSIKHNIPTPNIWAGGMNFHSRLEWISVEWMVAAVETTLTLLRLWTERAANQAKVA